MRLIRVALFVVASVTLGSSANAEQQTKTFTITADMVPNAEGVAQDAAPGFDYGSVKSLGTGGKIVVNLTDEALFGRNVLLGEVKSMSYFTKKGVTHAIDSRDFYVNTYTARYAGQVGGSFYGVRLGTEPYFAMNMYDPPNEWTKWTTADGMNQLRFFESTYGYFGSYTDPKWASFLTQTSLAGSSGAGVPYASQSVLYFSIQTASGWYAGFTGQIDGLELVLTDGTRALVNFEPFNVATDKDQCKKGGYMTLRRPDGSSFSNQGDCVSFVASGM